MNIKPITQDLISSITDYITTEFQLLTKTFPNNFTYTSPNKFLFNNKPLLWKNIKEYGLTKNLELLRAYGNFRKHIVDHILETLKLYNNCNKCTRLDAGSVTVTSDYDIAIFGEKREDITVQFNEIFETIFHDESGNILDTNIYGIAGLLYTEDEKDIKKLNQSFFKTVQKCTMTPFSYLNIPPNTIQDINNQHTWAFVKLIRYLKEQDFDYIERNMTKMSLIIDIENAKLLFRKNNQELKKYPDTHSELEKYNKLYDEKLEELKLKRESLEKYIDDKSKETLEKDQIYLDKKINFKNFISETNYFGSETYYTQGAYLHVVGILQIGLDNLRDTISRDELLDSFIENMADAFKEIYYYNDEEEEDEEENRKIMLIIKISKYITRSLDAVMKMNLNISKNIQDAYNTSNFIQKNYKGKQVKESCDNQKDCINIPEVSKKIEKLMNFFDIDLDFIDDKLLTQKLSDFVILILNSSQVQELGQELGQVQVGGYQDKYKHKYMKYKLKYLNLLSSSKK